MSSVTPPDSNAGSRPRNARGHGAQLRTDLLDATLGLLAGTGDPEDVSIRAVAKAVGVSPTAVYQHFDDRDAVLEAACERAFEVFSGVLAAATSVAQDPFERLSLAGRAYLRYALDEPGLYRVLFSNPLHLDHHAKGATFPDADSAGTNAFDALVLMVQDCLDSGARAGTAAAGGAEGEPGDALYLAFQVWTWLHGIVDLRITHPGMAWPSADRMVDDIALVLGLERPPS